LPGERFYLAFEPVQGTLLLINVAAYLISLQAWGVAATTSTRLLAEVWKLPRQVVHQTALAIELLAVAGQGVERLLPAPLKLPSGETNGEEDLAGGIKDFQASPARGRQGPDPTFTSSALERQCSAAFPPLSNEEDLPISIYHLQTLRPQHPCHRGLRLRGQADAEEQEQAQCQ
jgi:hypothetical protein